MPCKENRPKLAMLSPADATKELSAAAASLVTRAKILRVDTDRVPKAAWKTLAPHIQEYVPAWLQSILSRFPLYGLGLEYRDRTERYARVFSFAGPAEFNTILDEGSMYFGLLEHGHLPVGYESDGNLWTLEAPFEAGSRIFLFDYSSWDGSAPTRRNGFTFASSRLALLLCSMAVSEISYRDRVTSVMWHPDYAISA